jgi:hypothetical protein
MGLEALIPIFGISIVLVPIIGLTTILTLRFGARPFIESLAKEMRGSGLASGPEQTVQIADLSEQIELLAGEVRRLKDAQEFDNRLLEGQGEPVEHGP